MSAQPAWANEFGDQTDAIGDGALSSSLMQWNGRGRVQFTKWSGSAAADHAAEMWKAFGVPTVKHDTIVVAWDGDLPTADQDAIAKCIGGSA